MAFLQSQPFGPLRDQIGRQATIVTAVLDCPSHTLDGVFTQELQHSGELTRSGEGTVPRFQTLAQLAEYGRQRPILEHGRVVQVGRLSTQERQVVERIEHMLPAFVAPLVPGHDHPVDHDLDLVHASLHGGRLECETARHAVAVVVEGRCLVFVDLARFTDARVERMFRQGNGEGTLLVEAMADGFTLAGGDSF